LKPKFPYFKDWDTIFDAQGNPEIKALYHIEYKCEGGHPDFVYWRRKFEALDIEEKTRNELIKQAMDRMMQSEDVKEHPVDAPIETEIQEVHRLFKEADMSSIVENERLKDEVQRKESTKTYDNIYHHDFLVPTEVYSDEEYRGRLNNARTLEEVEQILEDYNRHHRKEPEPEQPKKKKHWWQ
jgi:hypothetical protein